MYKLIAIDLDGTLLNSYGEVSNKNREAIEYAQSKGIEVVLASGRDPKTMEKISNELGIQHYLIAGNGASVYDMQLQKNIYENFLSKEKVLQMAKICKENSIFFSIYTTNGIITEDLKYNIKVFYNENSFRPNQKRTQIEIAKDIVQYIEEHDLKILKLIICDENKIIFNNIIEKMKKIKNVEVLEVEHMSKKIIHLGTEEYPIEYFYTEITNQNTNKWEAIQFLLQKLQVKPEEVMTIGDNMNDYQMIQKAGLGIAMKNSAIARQNIADDITEDHNEDGVGKAIFKYI